MNVLLIVASGKSSRFGGFPKAFCKINDTINVENTVSKAHQFYDKIYIGVNNKIYDQYKDQVNGCEMFGIVTGQGDAHSIIKCLDHIRKQNNNCKSITVCWGDAVFVDSMPFEQLLKGIQKDDKVVVACAIDKKPYAWFDVDDDSNIIKSHFAKDEGFISKGLHDQSLFWFDMEFAYNYLNEYREYLKIPYFNDEDKADVNEMKLLFSFEYLHNMKKEKAKCVTITSGKVLSFNTKEELDEIKRMINS